MERREDEGPMNHQTTPAAPAVLRAVSKSHSRRVAPAPTSRALADQQSELRKLIRHVAAGHEHALIVTGPGGLGKSYTASDELQKNRVVPHLMNARCAPFTLYQHLYEHRASAEVTLLDDVDSLDDRTVLSYLKAATEAPRIVNNNSSTPLLAKKNLPDTFKFDGGLIVLANEVPTTRSWKAFVTRLLSLHIEAAPAEVIAFMRDLTRNGFLVEMGTGPVTLSAADCRQVIDYLAERHVTNLRHLRQALKLFHAHRAHDEWKGLVAAILAGAAQQVSTARTSDEHIVLALEEPTDLTREQRAQEFTAAPGGGSRATYFRRLAQLGLT